MLWLPTTEAQDNLWIEMLPQMDQILMFMRTQSDFEPIGQENHTNLENLTQELDDLHHRVQAGEDQPAGALHCIAQELQRLLIALCPSGLPEPLDDVLQQYMDTLCSAQRQTNFTNTLLQNIYTTGNDATQLEDCLLDIETAADLSAESRIKLAQANSRGLTHTLTTEALTSGKSKEDIKDLLHLKVYNSDIHTSVSHFMEIQQREKESLAAYIQFYKQCSNNKDIHKRTEECPHHSHSSL